MAESSAQTGNASRRGTPAGGRARNARFTLAHARGDLTGGLTAALLSVPISIGHGLFAFAPLGPEFVPYAIVAGLYCALFMNLVAALFGADSTMVYAPRSVVAFMISALVLHVLVGQHAATLAALPPPMVVAVVLLIMLMAGLIQIAFGLLGLGNVVKYAPFPVIAGFQNAAALLLLLGQIDALLGLPRHLALDSLPGVLAATQPLTLLVGLATAVVCLAAPRLLPRVPAPIAGLAAGAGLYYLLAGAGAGAMLGPVIGAIAFQWPAPDYAGRFVELIASGVLAPMLASMTLAAFSLALVASLDGLLCAKAVEGLTGKRMNGNRELLRFGCGNVLAACFGGLSGGVNLAASFANGRAGARTGLSLVVCAGALLAGMLLLSEAISLIPHTVIAALLAVVAIQLFDRRTVRAAAQWWRDRRAAPSTGIDLGIVATITLTAVVFDVLLAVAVGLAISLLSFVLRMSHSVVRRQYDGAAVRSRRERTAAELEALRRHGARIQVFELEGALFFGTAEQLANRLDGAAARGAELLILDLGRIREIDSTGARILLQARDRLAADRRSLALCALDQRGPMRLYLEELGLLAAFPHDRRFPDADRALEWAEDRLLSEASGPADPAAGLALERLELFAGCPAHELERVRARLGTRRYAAGETVIRAGAHGTELFMIVRGSASVSLGDAHQRRGTRLTSFGAGTTFGELALLDRERRSATVVADTDLVCHTLSADDLGALVASDPALATRLLRNLARVLAHRLRHATHALEELSR